MLSDVQGRDSDQYDMGKRRGTNKMHLGNIRHGVSVCNEYQMLAKKDEAVAVLLKEHSEYKHSIYFFIQAMEKYIRAKIFTLVNPNLEYFRKRNQNHSIDNAIEFLVDIISADENIQNQVKEMLNKNIIQGIKFQQLHNNLRYPLYNSRYDSYSSVDFTKEDCKIIENKLADLKIYLNELHRL